MWGRRPGWVGTGVGGRAAHNNQDTIIECAIILASSPTPEGNAVTADHRETEDRARLIDGESWMPALAGMTRTNAQATAA